MADVATTSDKKALVKPENPDEKAYEAALKKAQREHEVSQGKFNTIKAKVDNAQGNKNSDTPEAKKRGELIAQLKEIKEKQGAGKAGRNKVSDEIKRLDEKLKSQIAEAKTARGKSTYKSVEDIDRQIKSLQAKVESATMKIVDERKALDEVNKLIKEKKQFKGFDESQKKIEETKQQIADLRKTADNPESKALSEKFNKLQAELDVIKAEQDGAYKNISALRADRDKAYNDLQEKYHAVKKIKDDHWSAKKAFQHYEYEARQRARERRKNEQAAYELEKKKERAAKLFEEASEPAYLDQIRQGESLLRFLDPSYTKENTPLKAPSQFTASAQRTVEDSGIKGMKVVKKDEEDYFKPSVKKGRISCPMPIKRNQISTK